MAVELALHLRDAAAFDHRLAFGDPAGDKACQKQKQEQQDHAQRRIGKGKDLMPQSIGLVQHRPVSDGGKGGKNADQKAFANQSDIFTFPYHNGRLQNHFIP